MIQKHCEIATDTDQVTSPEDLMARILRECPQRGPASQAELDAQKILRDELLKQGGSAEFVPFRFNTNLYAVVALHFGLAAVGCLLCLVSPLAAFLLHLVVFVSYLLDSAKVTNVLRWLLPRHDSQNLLVTFPAPETRKRRIVIAAHADAAPAGKLFQSQVLKLVPALRNGWIGRTLGRPLLMAMLCLVIVASIDLRILLTSGLFWWTTYVYTLLALYFTILAVVNLEVALVRDIVPGANDNLSGCVALPELAKRLVWHRPDDVELVFVVTGCEEAGTGGASALARRFRKRWNRAETAIVVLDSIGSGELHIVQDGEVLPAPASKSLASVARKVAAEDDRFAALRDFHSPAGATDATAFSMQGFHSICFNRIDATTGLPSQYHLPTDDLAHLDTPQLAASIDFAEQYILQLAHHGWSGDIASAQHQRLPATQAEALGVAP